MTEVKRALESMGLKVMHAKGKGGGFYKIDYGFSCGRHWVTIDGKTVVQSDGADVYLPDEQIVKLVKGTIGAPEWKENV